MLILLATLIQQPARDPHAVQPERPTVATHAHTVAPGFLEIETGVEYDHDTGSHSWLAPLVFKVGVASHVQLTIMTPSNVPADGTLGPGDASVGVKWRLLDDAPVLGDFAVLPAVKLATGSTGTGCRAVVPSTCVLQPPHGTGTTDLSLTVISSHMLGPLSLDINVGYTRRGDLFVSRDATLWTMSWGGPFVAPVGWVFEVFGYPPAGQDNIVGVVAGPTFSIDSWLTADAGIIAPLTGPQTKAFYVGGVVNVGRLW